METKQKNISQKYQSVVFVHQATCLAEETTPPCVASCWDPKEHHLHCCYCFPCCFCWCGYFLRRWAGWTHFLPVPYEYFHRFFLHFLVRSVGNFNHIPFRVVPCNVAATAAALLLLLLILLLLLLILLLASASGTESNGEEFCLYDVPVVLVFRLLLLWLLLLLEILVVLR